ncbi:hypothetical protein JF50_21465 [Pseudoalteromonas luteoviolacea]|uniref:Tail specific protease domain-containing protein n=1 Tax=Pseudoalteromonas luteoviolacea TaxID=43657 RepID=A0A0C1Q4B8_9GAMM|nr:S41 family peptidase [Pseudoalteromonas luteoviolacea]KID55416.1 hypothetical protein JF50_21465 [Pseudoalteromonas luteoviolacea]
MTLALKCTSCLIAASLLLVGCQDNQDHRSDLQHSAGLWHKPGYGAALQITMNRVLSYQYNSYGCIEISTQTHHAAKKTLSSITMLKPNRLRIQHHGAVFPHHYTQLDRLPAQCESPITVSSTVPPSQVFDYFWHAFNDYYAFFSLKDLDWQAQYQQYRGQVKDTMSDEALFHLLSEMIAPLHDMHVTLSSPNQHFFAHKPAPIFTAIKQDAALLRIQGNPHDLNRLFKDYQIKSQRISQQYLVTESVKTRPEHSDNATAMWGKTASNVGVLVLNNFTAFATKEDATEIQHLNSARTMMDTVMADLKETEAMIIDIRHNIGGNDAIPLAIANYFANRNVLAFNKQAINTAGLGMPVRQQLQAKSSAYTQPIYLLTSQLTASAAEVFTMAMAQLPHVTLVGEETAGALSAALHLTLPNGWQLSLSNEVYRNAQGDMFEHSGFIPEYHVPAFSQYDLEMQRFETYDFVLNKLNKAHFPKMDIDDFERQISLLQTQSNIPSIAVNVFAQGKSIYHQGFSNDVARQINADSLFDVTGLDEILIGNAIHSANKNGDLLLDEPIAHWLPFALSHSNAHLTLTQLLTHQSGIIDNPNMTCAPAANLAHCIGFHDSPDILLAAYLNEDGSLYHASNFSSHYGGLIDDTPIYSRLGIALTSYAFTQATRTPLPELAHRYIFKPLKMEDTHWKKTYSGTKSTHQLISTANDISKLLNKTAIDTKTNQRPDPHYFWYKDNQNTYHRSQSTQATSLLFTNTFSQTGYILLTDQNPQTKEAKALHHRIEQLVFRLAQQLSKPSQQRN